MKVQMMVWNDEDGNDNFVVSDEVADNLSQEAVLIHMLLLALQELGWAAGEVETGEDEVQDDTEETGNT